MINAKLNNILKALLLSLPVYNDTSYYNNMIGVRCPFCGDSKKSLTKTHLNVRLTDEEFSVPVYRCNRCGASGRVDSYFLDLLGLYNSDFEYENKINNKNAALIVGNKGFKQNKIKPIKLLPPLNNESTRIKKEYIENRLGIKLTVEDIKRYKIIFNLYDFLEYNKIKTLTRKEYITDGLDNQYVGFLTCNNEFINFRNIGNIDEYYKRYINYNIFGIQDNTKRFYILSNNINIMKKCKIIIAEGVFDILGIYNHIYNKETKDNVLFCAVQGMGYNNIIKYINKLGIIFANYEIYSDAEVELKKYIKLKDELGFRVENSKFTICYNLLSKDCGVTKDKIKIKKYEI